MLLRNPGSGKGKYRDVFGKNEQVKKVFWILFVAMAGLVLARDGSRNSSAGCGDYCEDGSVRG